MNISGKVRDSSLLKNPTPIVLMVLNPDGGIVTIAQTNLDSDNKYSVSMVAGGPLWKATGEYTVKAQYGASEGRDYIYLYWRCSRYTRTRSCCARTSSC